MRCFWSAALAPQVSDKRVTFAPETKSSTAGATVPADWGFRFVVEPLRGVHYRVVRELELICRFGGRVRSGGGASAAGTTFGPQVRHRHGIRVSTCRNAPSLGEGGSWVYEVYLWVRRCRHAGWGLVTTMMNLISGLVLGPCFSDYIYLEAQGAAGVVQRRRRCQPRAVTPTRSCGGPSGCDGVSGLQACQVPRGPPRQGYWLCCLAACSTARAGPCLRNS